MPKRFFTPALLAILLSSFIGCASFHVVSQSGERFNGRQTYDLNSGWVCKNIQKVDSSGYVLSNPSHELNGWIPATVPGTVLTTMLNDSLIPDPFYGMNNKKIPDIYQTGPDYYTYWFVKHFTELPPSGDGQVWLNFRGVNYGCNVFLNGRKLDKKTHYGMFLRQSYNITRFISKDGNNRLAVIVYPPNPVGNPNGGQGGDGTIARSVTNQFVAGWDWIQPVHDRNTGIWDKVTIVRTEGIRLRYPHIVTIVPGKRFPGAPQAPAIIVASVRVQNPSRNEISGTVGFLIAGHNISRKVTLPPASMVKVQLPDFTLQDPKLWWPNGYGKQNLYRVEFTFSNDGGRLLDNREVTTGIRQIDTRWNSRTQSREVFVNGQKIFIKGGDWIVSDEMLRLSRARYDAEIRFQHEMNLNLIRVWGGGITERPDFYDACDKYGMLVFQDFWVSGDCNGKWLDPTKKDDQWVRRQYPDNHKLFLESVADQVRMLRNHPSLAFYCGGNELPPPEDILSEMQNSLLPALDSTRYFFTYSNTDSMSYNFIGGNGDGPYHIEPTDYFWEHRSFSFNSEVGSVGMGDYQSLERFIPPKDLVIPDSTWAGLDSVWRYHKYIGYGNHIDAYGKPATLRQFAKTAQLVNYDQYRALMEGHLSHMWSWYTGVIIWKTQNPWTALRGQMYDYYLDPNGGLYGLRHAGESLHVMYNPVNKIVEVVNQTFQRYHDLMLEVRSITPTGKDSLITSWIIQVRPTSVQKYVQLERIIPKLYSSEGGFLDLRLLNMSHRLMSENLYWLPDSTGQYTGIEHMPAADITAQAAQIDSNRIAVNIKDPSGGPLAFFNRISLVDSLTGKRILPVFYSDNYVSVLPGEQLTVYISCTAGEDIADAVVSISGWNVKKEYLHIR